MDPLPDRARGIIGGPVAPGGGPQALAAADDLDQARTHLIDVVEAQREARKFVHDLDDGAAAVDAPVRGRPQDRDHDVGVRISIVKEVRVRSGLKSALLLQSICPAKDWVYA
jgi:hypothetical protein